MIDSQQQSWKKLIKKKKKTPHDLIEAQIEIFVGAWLHKIIEGACAYIDFKSSCLKICS
jgi:hypothetical protein